MMYIWIMNSSFELNVGNIEIKWNHITPASLLISVDTMSALMTMTLL